MVTVERHLWLNLTDIKEKNKSFLMDAPISKDGLFGDSVTAVVEKFRAAKQQSAAFRQLIPRRPREVERRQMLTVCSRSSFSHRQRGAPREEPSPMAPPRKNCGPRVYPLARQRKRLDLRSTAKTSRPWATNNSSGSFCCSSGTVQSTRERCWTTKAYPTLSLQSPGSNIDRLAAERTLSSIRASHNSERPLRQSAHFSLQVSRDGPRVWQGRPIYDGPQNCCFAASSGA